MNIYGLLLKKKKIGCRNEWCIFNNGSINANHEEIEYDCKMKKNDIIGCYFDTKEGTLYFIKNGIYTSKNNLINKTLKLKYNIYKYIYIYIYIYLSSSSPIYHLIK